MREKLSFYTVDSDYCDFLRNTEPKDSRVPYVTDEKQARPFVGIVFSLGAFNYYAPLSSPKPKHFRMKAQVDLIKIDSAKLGVINLNNMIPVPATCLHEVSVAFSENDALDDKRYKRMMQEQRSWCRTHQDTIVKKAAKLHRIVTNRKGDTPLSARCCLFAADEEKCAKYNAAISQGIAKPWQSAK